MSTWTSDELDAIGRVGEIRLAGRRADGSIRPLVIVWHVVVDGALYVRSVRGADGRWYRGVLRSLTGALSWGGPTRDVVFAPDSSHNAAVDAAYAAKYGNGPATAAIVSAVATPTTLRIEPA